MRLGNTAGPARRSSFGLQPARWGSLWRPNFRSLAQNGLGDMSDLNTYGSLPGKEDLFFVGK